MSNLDKYVELTKDDDDVPLLINADDESVEADDESVTIINACTIKAIPNKALNVGFTKIDQWFDIIPIRLILENHDHDDGDENYELWAREDAIRMVKQSITQSKCINKNNKIQTKEIMVQLMNMPNQCDRISGNKTFKDVSEKLHQSLDSKSHEIATSIRTMPGCGYQSNHITQVNIWIDKDTKSVFVQGRTLHTIKEVEQARLIPKTSGLEAFATRREDSTVVYSNGSYTIPSPIETFDSIDAMKIYLDDMVKLSIIDVTHEMPRFITSNQADNSEWKGILVTNQVFEALNKKGAIFEHIHGKYKLKLKLYKALGQPTKSCKKNGHTRLIKIEW